MTMPGGDLNFADLYKEATTVLTGEFDVIFTECTAATSGTNKPMLKYKAAVEGGPHHGHIFYGNITLSAESSAAMRIFFSQLAAIGLGETFMKSLPPGAEGFAKIAENVVSKRAHFVVESRAWQGVDRESVKSITAGKLTGPVGIGGGGPTPMAGPPGLPSGPPGLPQTPPPVAPAVPAAPSIPTPQTPAPPATPAPVIPPPTTDAPVAPATPETQVEAPPALPY